MQLLSDPESADAAASNSVAGMVIYRLVIDKWAGEGSE